MTDDLCYFWRYFYTFHVIDNYGTRIDSNSRQPETVRRFMSQEH